MIMPFNCSYRNKNESFDTAARSDALFWHPDPKCISGSPADSPLVMALADFTDNDFEEIYAPCLQRKQDWVILTPPLPNGASDGSLEDGRMGAGVYIVRSGKALRFRVGRSRESRTSLRVETGASYLALEHGRDIAAPIFILTDSANHLAELEDWVGPGKYPTLHSSKDDDIVRGVLELLHHRVTLGFPTFFVKVRAHRGEPYNEAADRIASTATRDEDIPLLWNAPSGRIIYQFAPDESSSEDDFYSASMNDTVQKFIKNQAAMSSLFSSSTQG
jgi:ribonuclease HI